MKKYIPYIVSIVCILWLLYISNKNELNLREVVSVVRNANLFWVLMGILAIIGNVIMSAWRMQYILRIFNLQKSIGYLIKLYLVGNFYNIFLPTQMGGDVYKAYRLSKDLGKPGEGTFTIFMDRFSGLVVLYIVGLMGLLLKYGTVGFILALSAFCIVIGIYFVGLSVFSKENNFLIESKFIKGTKLEDLISKTTKLVQKFKKANDIFIKNKVKAINVFGTAVLVQLFAGLTTVFAFYAVGADVPIWAFFLFIPVITIMGLIPSIAGLGVQENAFNYFFNLAGVLSEQAVAASILVQLMKFSTSLFGGVVLLIPKWNMEDTNIAQSAKIEESAKK